MKLKVLKLFGYFCCAVGITIPVFIRVYGYDLTEGELLIKYWRWWLLVPVVSVVGYGSIVLSQNKGG